MSLKRTKKQNGITLIALVITIIVLLILAAVTIGALTGDNGILKNAAKAKRDTEIAKTIEQIRLDIYGEMANNEAIEPTAADIERIADKYGDIEGTNFDNKVLKTEEGNYEIKLSDIWELSATLQPGETATAKRNEYKSDNKMAKIPEGFTVSNVSGETTINGGLVIYYIPEGTEKTEEFWTADSDGDGSPDVQENYDQYVWIPVDGILGEGGKSLDNAAAGEVILGRYVFKENGTIDMTPGTTPTELGGELKTLSSSSDYYIEDTTEEDINLFIESVRKNHGYYIGRYEAGNDSDVLTVRKGKSVYNNVTQPRSSELCQNLYIDVSNVKSDLINSYAWDTAILYIQRYSENKEYSRQIMLQSTPTNTGEATDGSKNDNPCNIYDMAGNYREWTTEISITTDGSRCVSRGGIYGNDHVYTSHRNYDTESASYTSRSFRSILFL